MNKNIKLYFFDMDHTLIDNDCDVSWKQFVVAEKLAGPDALKQADYFFDQYNAGTLDSDEFMRFQLREFAGRTETEMAELTRKHFDDFVRDRIYPGAYELVRQLKKSGCKLALLSATNRIIAQPVVDFFGFDDVVATELELADGRYTGRIAGVYSCAEGKRTAAEIYCREHNIALSEVAYYGDSINDIYILDAVGMPIVVNPDDELRRIALKKNWEIISFKLEEQGA